ncbi:MAG TPA: hypothetical protein DEP69_05280 [Acidimicrobiaceae bacterium]|nr:hypothetical protein [Acidimicrobiaceae bacterium]
MVDTAGKRVGTVPAVELVTVGQRKGLGLGGDAQRRYAVEVDVAGRRVVVGDDAQLASDAVALEDHRWAGGPVVGEVLAQTSAHSEPHPATLDDDGDLRWHRPQRRPAPGQAVVFYAGDEVLGGGTARR